MKKQKRKHRQRVRDGKAKRPDGFRLRPLPFSGINPDELKAEAPMNSGGELGDSDNDPQRQGCVISRRGTLPLSPYSSLTSCNAGWGTRGLKQPRSALM